MKSPALKKLAMASLLANALARSRHTGHRLFCSSVGAGNALALASSIPGSKLLFENARTAVLSLDLRQSPATSVKALNGIDHMLLHWSGGGSTLTSESKTQSLEPGASVIWNAFSTGGTLHAGKDDSIGMQEAALVICKPYTGGGDGMLGGWPPRKDLPAGDSSFAYVPDGPDDALRPTPWTVTTDIAQQVLLENDMVRVWRFELSAGESCHAHQHVYPYFFYNLLDAQTRRLEWEGGVEPDPGTLTPKCPPMTAPARKVFWLDTLEGGARSTHFHALENHAAAAPFRQFIVEFKQGAAVQLRPSHRTQRDPPMVYLPGLHGGGSQFLPAGARRVQWAAPVMDGSDAVRANATVEAAAAEVLRVHADAAVRSCGRADLVLAGHSYGGMVAMEAARQWLDGAAPAGMDLKGLVLLSTVASAQSEEGKAAMARRRELASREGLQAELDTSWPAMIHPHSFGGGAKEGGVQEGGSIEGGAMAMAKAEREVNAHEAGLAAFLRQTDAIDARPCQHATLRRLVEYGVPVLLLHGEDDALAPLAEAEKAAASCGDLGELVVLERTGHLALVERPEETAEALRSWWLRWRNKGQEQGQGQGIRQGQGMRMGHGAQVSMGGGGGASSVRRISMGFTGFSRSLSSAASTSTASASAASTSAASASASASPTAVDALMSYCVPPPPGKQIGLRADAVAHPGLPVFSFYRQVCACSLPPLRSCFAPASLLLRSCFAPTSLDGRTDSPLLNFPLCAARPLASR